MLIMRGPLAYTHFRIERWLTHIIDIAPQVNSLRAEFTHFIDLEQTLSPEEQEILTALLDYGNFSAECLEKNERELSIVIVPKLGTISSWSRKATILAHHCGLVHIKRIERGITYYIEASEKLTWGDKQAIASLLHDPKTQTPLFDFGEVEKIFKARPTESVLNVNMNEMTHNENFYGYLVSNLCIPGFKQSWEMSDKPSQGINISLETVLELPVQNARLNNELGWPIIGGYFRTYEETGSLSPLNLSKINFDEAVLRLLHFPCIADKSFLITISDRTVTGLVTRDFMVGPWQVPVADCMVMVNGFDTFQGKAVSIGERAPLAHVNREACLRMAMGEAITNIAAANIGTFTDLQLSIHEGNSEKNNIMVQGMAPVIDVRQTLTPVLQQEQGETVLLFIDLSAGKQRLGQSALSQVFNMKGDLIPDMDDLELLKSFFTLMQQLRAEDKLLAYHDRSDGGLFITLCEMAFASHIGLQLDITELGRNAKSILFNEELGAVIQVRSEDAESVVAELAEGGVSNCYLIGTLDETDRISIIFNEETLCIYDRIELQKAWSETNFYLQSLRDNPRSAKTQYEMIGNREDPGLNVHLSFDPLEDITAPFLNVGSSPRVAILREEGVYSHPEMRAAFEKARFECVDVHMDDLDKGNISLGDFNGLAVCGGFSFGDELGAGQGWAKRILFTPRLKEEFENFFHRKATFALGLSNGCQMLSRLKSLIPGSELWPTFKQNHSEQFESRWCLVEVQRSTSIFLTGMEGSRIMVPVAHREGRAEFINDAYQDEAIRQRLVSLRYVDNWGRKTKIYPANPSGSSLGITGLSNVDGRILIMMPHPERAFRKIQHSWYPRVAGEDGPWLRMFRNARRWVG